MPEVPLHFLAFDFQIGNRSQEFRVPIHQSLVTIDEALGVQLHEYLAHCRRKPLIHREAFTWPIERCTKPAQLPRDGAARFRLPFPNALQEGLAPHAAAVWLLLFGQQAFHHHLRRNAGMVRARLPQRIAPLHAPPADQHILQGIIQRMADMQAAGHIRRRDHDGEGAGWAFRTGGKSA